MLNINWLKWQHNDLQTFSIHWLSVFKLMHITAQSFFQNLICLFLDFKTWKWLMFLCIVSYTRSYYKKQIIQKNSKTLYEFQSFKKHQIYVWFAQQKQSLICDCFFFFLLSFKISATFRDFKNWRRISTNNTIKLIYFYICL